jgi:hypothetical protein
MKKYLFPSLILLVFCFGCNNANQSGGMSDKAKKNLENAQAINKMFESGDWSKVGDYLASDAVDHTGMDAKGTPTEVKGLDSIKAEFTRMNAMSSDMKNETVKEMADDDYVFQWLKESWTAKTGGMGMTPGKRYTMNAIEVSKFNADGKATDHWSFVNMTDMMSMMPQPGNTMGNNSNNMGTNPDTSKMKNK